MGRLAGVEQENEGLKKQISELSVQFQAASEKASALASEKCQLSSLLAEQQKRFLSEQSKYNFDNLIKENENLNDMLDKKVQALTGQYQIQKNLERQLAEARKQSEDRAKGLESERDKLQQALEKAQAEAERVTASNRQLSEELGATQKIYQEKCTQFDNVESKTMLVIQENEKLNSLLIEKQREFQALMTNPPTMPVPSKSAQAFQELESSNKNLQAQVQSLQKALTDSEQKLRPALDECEK